MASNDMRGAGPPVNVATASESRLRSVPGIGEARARSLLEIRRREPLAQEVLLAMPNIPANFWREKLESEPPEVCCDPEQPDLESTTTEISDIASSHSNTKVKLEPAAEDSTTTGFRQIAQDQAAHFFSRLPSHHRCSYALLKEKLRTRFNVVQAPAVPRKQLQDVRQGMEESLQEFASRVQQLARDAHPSLVTEAVEPMAVDAFLRGCKEKLAAYSALNREPATVELAVNLVEGAVTNQQAVFGSTVPVSKLRQVLRFENPTQTQPDDYQVRAVHASSVEGLEAATERRFRQCEGALVEVKAGMSSLGEQMKEVMSLGSFQAKGRARVRSRSPSPAVCYNCNEPGHFSRECPKEKRPSRPRADSPERPQCFNCHEPGHYPRDCHKARRPRSQAVGSGNGYES
ncbi:hypothetical protein CAPTEDRAFT_208363 [Capitella teleta]|uniref:CCHC-type domain-containing protein n=1 Tax=Capitella teleta TaxID=283909 RepID=R7VB67_CAPTE|nr:hypothetical protein CAPTEDRAFT_208363 [Capitella teleta]|eukprot:ELU15777.1 hypothetical protein CAPTEDRAFT_208363 [Capitella teleta]